MKKPNGNLFSRYLAILALLCPLHHALATCPAVNNWQGTTVTWTTNGNWSTGTAPAVGGYPVIQGATSVPTFPAGRPASACFLISAGTLNVASGSTLTLSGDYFRNLNPGSLLDPVASALNFTVVMSGTAPQTFENVDPVDNLTISNSTSVVLTNSFSVGTLTLNSGTLYIDADVTVTNALTIPSNVTVEIRAGGTLHVVGGLTVNGVLDVDGGGKLNVGNGTTLSIGSTGVLSLQGGSGNIAEVGADGGTSYAMNVAGAISANYFSISRARTNAAGVNVTGTVQLLQNGEFHFINTGGTAITLGTGSISTPTVWNSVGFYNDSNSGSPSALDVTNFGGSLGAGTGITLSNYGGAVTGILGNTPTARAVFTTQAPLSLVAIQSSSPGLPAVTSAQGAASSVFGAVGFYLSKDNTLTTLSAALNASANTVNVVSTSNFPSSGTITVDSEQMTYTGTTTNTFNGVTRGANSTTAASHLAGATVSQAITSTNLTGLTATLAGINSGADVSSFSVGYDGTCPGGGGTIIGTGTFSGSPPTATVAFSPAVTLSNTTRTCLSFQVGISASASVNDSLAIELAGTSDVTNSANYSFSVGGAPPIILGYTKITGSPVNVWSGGTNTNWSTATNWSTSVLPTSSTDCQVGSAVRVPIVNTATVACRNATLTTGGTLSFNNTTNELQIAGNLNIGNSYAFTLANSGKIRLNGSVNQSINVGIPTTTLSSALTNVATTANVVSTAGFATTGTITIDSEQMTYTGLSGTTFTGLTRGANSTTAAAHASGATASQATATFPGALLINTTGSPVGTVTLNNNLTVGSVTLTTGNFTVASGVTLTVNGNVALNGGNFTLQPGANLVMANGTTITVASGATLTLVGTSAQSADVFAIGTNSYQVVVNSGGTIAAQYYSLKNLNTTAVSGLSIASGATINSTYNLSHGSFSNSVGNSGTLLNVVPTIPGSALTNMLFDVGTGTATGVTSINSTNPVTVTTYSGSWSGPTHSSANVTWTGLTNTLDLTQYASGPSTVNQGQTFTTMGRFGFKQTQAGAGFSDTNITSLKITITGTATVSDVNLGRLYYDSGCTGSTASLLGTATFSGVPATATFSGFASAVEHSATTPPTRCFVVQYDISGTAAAGKTLGAQIASSSDVANTQNYGFNGSAAPPVTLGSPATILSTTVTWTGAAGNTNWFNSGNWTAGGPPNSTQSCTINSQANNPTVTNPTSAVTMTSASPTVVTWTTHGLSVGSPVKFAGTLPAAITPGTVYFVSTVVSANGFNISATIGGANLNTASTGSGITGTAVAVCNSLTVGNGTLTVAAAANLDLYGSLTNTGTITMGSGASTISIRDNGTVATSQTLSSSTALSGLIFTNKTAGGNVFIGNNALTLNSLTLPAPSGTPFTFEVRSGDTLNLPNGATIAGSTFLADGNSTVATGNGKTITVSGGTLKTAGVNDAYIQATTNKALFTVIGTPVTNTWGITASSGNVDLTGFILDSLDTNGLNLTGSSSLVHFDGGQYTNLSQSFASMCALRLNTTGSLCTANSNVASNIGFNWGAANATYASPPSPTPSSPYSLVCSTGCSSHSLTFDQWFGDFSAGANNPNPSSKISTTSCTVTMSTSASPVTLTELTATAFNGSVKVAWATGLEWLHQGFNVYRSYSPYGGFAQTNASLIRNPVLSTTVHGVYEFIDRAVSNDTTYYYMIEDFAVNGTRTMHGPVAATPLAALGLVSTSASAISTIYPGPDPAPGLTPPAFSPAQQIVAPGVTLLAKTAHTYRLKIDVPGFTSVGAEYSPYLRVAIPGYSLATVAGRPELPERVIMLPIPNAQSASFTLVAQSSAVQTGVDIAPARQWISNGATLAASWIKDNAFYAVDQALPLSSLSLGKVTHSQGIYYLPVLVKPLTYNPARSTVGVTSQIIVDISLDGIGDWADSIGSSSAGVWGTEGGLQITLSHDGVYELGYADLVTAGVEGPFRGVDVRKLRLFSGATEYPLQVTSATGYFGAGDTLRFFSNVTPTFESATKTLLLVGGSSGSPDGVRMGNLAGDPTGLALTSEPGFTRKVFVEKNLIGYFSQPFAENVDHVLWGTFYAPPINPGEDSLAADFTLPDLMTQGTVTISAAVKGSHGGTSYNPRHHLSVSVNNNPAFAADDAFSDTGPHVSNLTFNAQGFAPGPNLATFRSVGDYTGTDYDVITLDNFNVFYTHGWTADSDVADVRTTWGGYALKIRQFSGSDIVVFDVTDPVHTAVVDGAVVTQPNPGSFTATFATFATLAGNPSYGGHFLVARASALPKPDSLSLNQGSALHDTSQGADAIFIGSAELLQAAAPLIALRTDQGFRVKTVDVESIFAEFGKGSRGGEAIKAFIGFASEHWTAPSPRYLIFVGDGSYDPKNGLGGGTKNLIPVHLVPGKWQDFASDNWFVAFNASDDLPELAIGRIPGNTAALIATYVGKVLDYEMGNARPTGAAAGKIAIAVDKDQLGGEDFAGRASKLKQGILALNDSLSINEILRPGLSDAQMNHSIIDAFKTGSTLIHYMGHGAEDRWADATVLTNADADALTNTTLPIVVSMNCLNAYFSDANPAYQSLADRLLFNPRGGAIAFWGSTSLTSPDVQQPYQEALYSVLAANPGIRLGDAVLQAKLHGGWSPNRAEVIRSWTLLGDPMLKVMLPANGSGLGGETGKGQPVAANDSVGQTTPAMTLGVASCARMQLAAPPTPGEIFGLAFPFLVGFFFIRWKTPSKKRPA